MADLQQETTSRTQGVARTLVPGTAMIAVTFGLARYGYGLLLPDMRADIAMSAGAAGAISSLAYLSYLIANVGVVWVTTRGGPRLAVGGAAALAAVGMGLISVADGVVTLGAGVMVAGAAAGMAFPPYADIVDRQVAPARRDIVWSTISSGTGFGVALAGPIAIAVGDRWRLAWAGFVVLAVGVGIVSVVLAPRRGPDLRRPQLSVTWFLCMKSRPLLLSAVLVGVGSSVWWVFSVDAMREAGLDATTARIVYAGCGAASILASVSGLVFERWGLRAGYLGTCALLGASLVVAATATEQVVAIGFAAALFGVFYSSVIAAQGIWSSRVFADHPSAGLAAVNTALTIGTLLGPTLAGLAIEEVGHPLTLAGAAVVTLAALPFCPPSRRRRAVLADHRCGAAPARP